MAASVAPPRLSTDTPGNVRWRSGGKVMGIQSPDSITRRRDDVGACVGRKGTSRVNAAGAESQTVMPGSHSLRAMRAGSASSAEDAISTAAPAPRAPKTSYTERSKLGDVTKSRRSAGVMWNVLLTQSRVLTTARWDSITPLGWPVLPEV